MYHLCHPTHLDGRQPKRLRMAMAFSGGFSSGFIMCIWFLIVFFAFSGVFLKLGPYYFVPTFSGEYIYIYVLFRGFWLRQIQDGWFAPQGEQLRFISPPKKRSENSKTQIEPRSWAGQSLNIAKPYQHHPANWSCLGVQMMVHETNKTTPELGGPSIILFGLSTASEGDHWPQLLHRQHGVSRLLLHLG